MNPRTPVVQTLPVFEAPSVYHVGTLDRLGERKRSSLYASRGLFVSLHPDAWKGIARLGGLPTWELSRSDAVAGRFVDWLALAPEQLAEITARSVRAGLLEEGALYEYRRHDDEWDQEFVSVFLTRREALREADGFESQVREVRGHLPTDRLLVLWREHFTRAVPELLAAAQFAHELVLEEDGYDGIWWDETLDVSRLSAPQGVIFAQRRSEWEARRL